MECIRGFLLKLAFVQGLPLLDPHLMNPALD